MPYKGNNVDIKITVNGIDSENIIFKTICKKHLKTCHFDKSIVKTSTFYAKLENSNEGVATFKLYLYESSHVQQLDVKVTSGDFRLSLPTLFVTGE